jgi:dipeptidyl aminopeptidase/acylaminoacyl peptidase
VAPRFAPRAGKHLLARELLFSEADRTMARITPDGKRIAFATHSSLVIGSPDDLASATPIQIETRGTVGNWYFTNGSDRIVYNQDIEGKEEWRVYAYDLATRKTTDLTPPGTVSAYTLRTSAKQPDKIALVARAKDAIDGDVFVADMRTGKSERIFENKERWIDYDLDADFHVRIATRMTRAGEKEVWRLPAEGHESDRELLLRVPLEDQLTTVTRSIDSAGTTLYATDSRGRDTAALVAIDLHTRASTVIGADERADVVNVLLDGEGKPSAYAVDSGKREWRAVDPEVAKDLGVIADDRHVLDIVSRTRDDKTWILAESAPSESRTWSIYDRTKREKKVLFVERPKLADHELAPMHVVQVRARDGLDLVGYLTLPPEVKRPVPPEPLPMALVVHGGPWDRDTWSGNGLHAILADRGYAVLSVNFRGSLGLGKRLVNAGDREWGGKMQDDLLDAVAWAIQRKIADPTRIAIVGGSYGGYAALMGMARDHGTFACGVDIEGPSDLVAFADALPRDWTPFAGQFRARLGDYTTASGRKDLLARSPITLASSIDKPLLVVQGKNDRRVNERESARIAEAVRKNGVPVTYLLYKGEGHGFTDWHNWRSLIAVIEVFLSQCIGGVYEPFGSALEDSTIDAVLGGEHIAGLAAAALR